MKITVLKSVVLIASLMASASVLAYDPDKKVACKKPRFTDFNLTTYNAADNIQVPPESEFFFKLPALLDPTSITLAAKKQPLEIKVESNSTFHKVKAKLPAALTGQFVTLDAYAKSTLGCDQHHAWMIKIADQ